MRITTTILGGDQDPKQARLRLGGTLPYPGADATERQILDFAAVVALDRADADTAALQHFAARAANAYRTAYGIERPRPTASKNRRAAASREGRTHG
jgi:hypothetical protein